MSKSRERKAFLSKLHAEAEQQAKLRERQLLPEQFGWIGSVIGRYPWQFLAVTSGLTALGLEILIRLA